MSSWLIWIMLAAAASGAGGYFLGRSSSAGVKRSLQLEEELQAARGELERYRNNVVEHFTTTAQLFNKLTADYRAVYHHVARGAHELTAGRTPQLDALSAPAPQIELSPPPPMVDELLAEAEEDDDYDAHQHHALSAPSAHGAQTPEEGWYDDVAPGTEVPDFARDRRLG
ncbi:MAG: YhcB family protein [Chromatiales bacterium]|nr:YhcB family protein [Chromatiales bacterium]